jgi:hypothetical protein
MMDVINLGKVRSVESAYGRTVCLITKFTRRDGHSGCPHDLFDDTLVNIDARAKTVACGDPP